MKKIIKVTACIAVIAFTAINLSSNVNMTSKTSDFSLENIEALGLSASYLECVGTSGDCSITVGGAVGSSKGNVVQVN